VPAKGEGGCAKGTRNREDWREATVLNWNLRFWCKSMDFKVDTSMYAQRYITNPQYSH
jgi:hypothetical protein